MIRSGRRNRCAAAAMLTLSVGAFSVGGPSTSAGAARCRPS
jgi:hypothetical protein